MKFSGDRQPRRYMVLLAVLWCAVGFIATQAWAAHPLITDDTGTQGRGRFQLEINGQSDTDKEVEGGVTTKSTSGQVMTILSSGIAENTDLVLSLPYQWSKVEEDGVTISDENGIADATAEIKWRFFEREGLSFALKPGIRFPAGNDDKGLGAGRTGYQAFFIGSKEAEPWEFHTNLGYIRNENRVNQAEDIWHASLAATYEVREDLKLVGNIGVERNRDNAARNDPAFLLGGAIYSFSESFDVDFGVKYGLTSSETDWSFLAGTTFRF